eukprot:4750413-Amphidinium_carterae.1
MKAVKDDELLKSLKRQTYKFKMWGRFCMRFVRSCRQKLHPPKAMFTHCSCTGPGQSTTLFGNLVDELAGATMKLRSTCWTASI